MVYPTRYLSGTVIAVTGATAGIGAATAAQLVDAGAKVVLGGRREQRLEEIVGRLGADNALGVRMDVQVPEDNQRLVAAALSTTVSSFKKYL